MQICILPVHRSNRYADETLIGETSYLKMTAIVAAMMIAPATTAMATELFILQKMRPGAPVFQPGRLPQSNSTRPSVWTFDQLECGDVGAFYPRLQRSPADFTGCVAGARYQELCFGAFVLGAAIAFDDGRHSRNMRLKPDVFQPETPPPSNSLTTAFGVRYHSASLAGQAMNRYRGTQAEFQFSIVSPHTAHSKLLISRASAMCSLRS